MRLKAVMVSALILALVTPTVLATHGTWLAENGMPEPNTKWDTSDYIWQHPNDGKRADFPVAERIYFNAFLVHSRIPTYDAQLDGGAVEVPLFVQAAAALGYWRDCNGDGYVGAKVVPAQQGSWGAYPRDLYKINLQLCPPGSPYNQDGATFVDEFRWIGPDARQSEEDEAARKQCKLPTTSVANIQQGCLKPSKDRMDVSDARARIWGDFGYPGGDATIIAGATPRGTFGTSDGTLRTVDDFVQNRLSGAAETAQPGSWASKPNVGPCDPSKAFLGGPTGTCGAYPLYQVKRIVNDMESGSDRPDPLVGVFDNAHDADGSGSPCDDSTTAGRKHSDVSPSVNSNPAVDGSIGGSVGNVLTGTNQGQMDGKCADFNFPDIENDRAPPGDFKWAIDHTLSFFPDQRLQTLEGQGIRDLPWDVFGFRGGSHAPLDSPIAGNYGGPRWLAFRGYRAFFALFDHGTLADYHLTLYADVGDDALTGNREASVADALPGGRQDAYTYGRDQCANFDDTPGNRAPNAQKWVCSRAKWLERNQLESEPSRQVIGVPFDLRDVDCYDNRVTEKEPVGIRASLVSCADDHR